MQAYDVPASMPAKFLNNVQKYGDRPQLHAKRGGRWRAWSWVELERLIRRAARGLIAVGLEPGERTAILSENRPEWFIADFATQFAGCANAPVYTTNTPEQCAYVIRDSGAKVAFVSNKALLDKLVEAGDSMGALELIVMFDDAGGVAAVGEVPVISLEQLCDKGETVDAGTVDERVEALSHDDLLTLIYTSGTTGQPKGVMLTQGNMVHNASTIVAKLPVLADDAMLSFLPLSHSFERMAGHYVPTFTGTRVYYAESVERLLDNLAEVRPTVMSSVPRIYEKVYASFMAKLDQATGVQRTIMDRALETGYEVSRALQRGQQPGPILALKYTVAKKLVFSKLADKLGGRIRYFVSGGAPLSRDIQEFFHAAGLLILEGYGLTETAPILTCNLPDAYRFGTVGKVVPGVEIKIASDGEILARGPNIMKGYYNRPEATAEVLLDGGWFATGDIGEFDGDGFLRITDRKKDLIKTAGGKYVAPQGIENQLKLQPHVEQVCVIGDRRPYCVALIVPEFVALEEWAKGKGLDTSDRRALLDHPDVMALIEEQVSSVNRDLGRWETVKYFHLLDEAFSQENGLLTPTMKVRRKQVMATHADAIDALYEAGADRKRA